MVDFVGVARVQELVAHISPGLFMKGLATEIGANFRRWYAFEKSARHATRSPLGVMELMPVSDGRLYAFKYVNGHPKSTEAGMLTVAAFGMLAEVRTGYSRMLAELTLTTALRTAATSALAAQWMARPDCRVMALIGNGALSEFQAIAFYHMLGIRKHRLYDVDSHATDKLERNLNGAGLADLCSVRCASTAEAVRDADIVTTVTADKRNTTIVTPDMIRPGMHLNAIGGDCPGKTELHADILRRADARIVVEYEPQSRIEGEIQQLEADFPVIELADVASGRALGRACDDEVTIFDSVGFALEDFSALCYLRRIHLQHGGDLKWIDLIPEVSNPKDLYGLLAPQSTQSPHACLELAVPIPSLA